MSKDTTDTSAARMRRLADLIRSKDLVIGTSEAADAITALAAERDALRLSLAEARNEALDDVIAHSWIAFHNCDEEFNVVSVGDIKALKTPTGDTNEL